MMQYMFDIKMLVGQFKFIDLFLPAQMTDFPHDGRHELGSMHLWQHPTSLLSRPVLELFMNLDNTQLTRIRLP